MVMDADVKEMEDGGKSDFDPTIDQEWTPVKVDRILHDNDAVELGGTKLVTKSSPRVSLRERAHYLDPYGGREKTWSSSGSPNTNPGYNWSGNTSYPNIVEDYFQGLPRTPVRCPATSSSVRTEIITVSTKLHRTRPVTQTPSTLRATRLCQTEEADFQQETKGRARQN